MRKWVRIYGFDYICSLKLKKPGWRNCRRASFRTSGRKAVQVRLLAFGGDKMSPFLVPVVSLVQPVPYHKLTLMPKLADISKALSLRYEGSVVSEQITTIGFTINGEVARYIVLNTVASATDHKKLVSFRTVVPDLYIAFLHYDTSTGIPFK